MEVYNRDQIQMARMMSNIWHGEQLLKASVPRRMFTQVHIGQTSIHLPSSLHPTPNPV